MTKLEALKKLRQIGRGSRGTRTIFEDGIFALYRGRYEDGADTVAALVKAAGGEVLSKWKSGKTVEGSPSWRVSFVMDCVADDALVRAAITVKEWTDWTAEEAA